MMCGWESQCALQFAAALFMKEKLGMDVTFYPTLDYQYIWWGQYWDGWNGSNAYPRNYFSWLADDDMDLVFEFWPSHIFKYNADGSEFFNAETEFIIPGTIDFGGSVGPYGEESVWVPQYLVEEYPDIIVPESIKDNAMYRELLINASMGIGGYCQDPAHTSVYGNCSNYIAMYAGRAGNPFDEPTYDRPTVWGSKDGYMMSEYCDDLLKTYPIAENVSDSGIDVNFVTTSASGETALAALVADMYLHRLPFLFNAYVPDINFGLLDPLSPTGELNLYEKMAYPRNSDQSADDICFQEKRCQYQISQIMKAANPRLETSFPEAHQFYSVYSLPASQLGLLISKFLIRMEENDGDSTMGKWLNATCDWMKDNSSHATWDRDSWNVDIVRYDCLNGCGVEAADGNYYGGSCDYYTGNCVCDDPRIFESTDCKESCPGFSAPMLNETGGNYYFEYCSGHGECDIETRQCSCEEGYGDDGCGTKYLFYDFVPLTASICAISGLLAIIGIGCIVWLRSAAEYKTVKALSVNMTTLMTVGIIFITCSNIALSVPVNSASCIAWQWLFGLGGILAIMAPLLKAYRVSRVFHGGKMLRAVKITDAMLMSSLIKGAVLEMVLCTAYSVSHEVFGGTHIYYNHDELRSEIKCNDSTITAYLSMGSYAYFFIILCALTYYSWGTRRALSVFKESTCAYFSSFLSLLCTLITFVFYMATDDPAFRVAVQAFAIIIVISTVLVLFYAQRIYVFYTEPEQRNVTDARGAASHVSQGSSSHSSVMKPGPNANA